MKRIGILAVTPELLSTMFGIPKKETIRNVFMDYERDLIKFVLEGEDMPECPEGAQIMVVNARLYRDVDGSPVMEFGGGSTALSKTDWPED